MRSCADLQREFDIAMDNYDRYRPGDSQRDAPFAYARAADDRMRDIGCYE